MQKRKTRIKWLSTSTKMFQDVTFYSPIGNISIIFSFSSAPETSFLVQNEIEPEQVKICTLWSILKYMFMKYMKYRVIKSTINVCRNGLGGAYLSKGKMHYNCYEIVKESVDTLGRNDIDIINSRCIDALKRKKEIYIHKHRNHSAAPLVAQDQGHPRASTPVSSIPLIPWAYPSFIVIITEVTQTASRESFRQYQQPIKEKWRSHPCFLLPFLSPQREATALPLLPCKRRDWQLKGCRLAWPMGPGVAPRELDAAHRAVLLRLFGVRTPLYS